jgi:ribosomal protein S20
MPIKKSAKKYVRITAKKTALNNLYKKRIKDLSKEIDSLIKAKKLEDALKKTASFQKAIDKAVKEKVIKSNTGDRKKSRLSIHLQKARLEKK